MSFIDHLRTWSAEDLSHLMESRPDLLPASDRGLEAVARKAGTAMSLGRVLVAADVGMLVVAEALVAKHPASSEELNELLGANNITAVIQAVHRLRRAGVVMVDETGVISPVGSLPDLLHRPLGLGPSFEELAEHLPTATIERLATATRAEGAGQRSPTVRAIAHRLRQPAVLTELLATASEETRDLLETLISHRSPAIPLPTGYPYRGLDRDDPLAWLIDAGLVVAVTDSGAELAREIVMASNADGLAPHAVLGSPGLVSVDGLPADVVSGAAADAANLLLHGAESLLRMVADGEVSLRKAGGIGPREIRRLAKICRLEAIDVARLFELLAVARLLKLDGGSLGISDLAPRWWAMARRRRYLVLVRAWLASERFLSRALAGQDDDDASSGKLVALGDAEPVAAVAAGRTVTLETICLLPPDAAFEPDQLAESVVWQGPNLWGAGEPPPEVLVDWTLAEAQLLGLINANSPSPLLRALIDGDEVELDRLAGAAMADDQDKFVLQSDMTAVAFGPLAPSVTRALSDMTERADGDADGRAPTFRFTETSVRQAFDRGWNQESITGFLNQHSLAGVPQPLEYLLADVARRYGSIKVMPAQSVIVTADDIVAVEVAANRKAAKLGLRLVAPTVLTSPLDPVTVTEALRGLGLFPTLDGSSIQLDVLRSDPTADPDDPTGDATGSGGHTSDLPADWTGPPVPAGPFPDEVSEAVSLLLEGHDRGPQTAAGSAVEHPQTGEARLDQGQTGPAKKLQSFWGRPVAVDALVDGSLCEIRGTVVGLGAVLSLLTVDGVVELPVDAVLTVSDPQAT